MMRFEQQSSVTYPPLVISLSKKSENDVNSVTAEILYNKGNVGREGIVHFVQCAATLLSDPSNYVREAALVAFDELANFLTPFDQENEIVPVITDLLGSDDRMDRVCGLLLLVSLIERGTALGGEAHLVNWLSQLLCDDDAEVRQVCDFSDLQTTVLTRSVCE